MGKIYNGGKNYGQGTDEGTFTIGDESGYYIDITTYPYAQVRIGEANDTENPPETIINPQDISTELVETNDVHKGIEVGSTAYWGYYEPEQGQELNPKSSSLDESLTWLRQNLGGDRNSTLGGKIIYDDIQEEIKFDSGYDVDMGDLKCAIITSGYLYTDPLHGDIINGQGWGQGSANNSLNTFISCIERSINGVDIEGEWENGWGYNASDASQYASSLYDFLGWVRENIVGIDGKITYNEQDNQIEISEAVSVDGSATVDHDLIKGGNRGYWGYQAVAQAHSTSLDSFASWVLDSLDGITRNASSGYYIIDGMKIYDDDIITSNADGWGYHAMADQYSTSLGETIQWLRENCNTDDGTVDVGDGDVVLNSDAQGTSYWTETDQSHSLYATLHSMDDRMCGYIKNYGYNTQDVAVSGDVRTEDSNGWGYYEGEEDDTSLKYVISDILSRLSTLENE